MKYTKSDLIADYKKKKRLKYIFFYEHAESKGSITKACFSQWYPSKFTVDNITYNSTEQYMMAQKALLFNDEKIYNEILKANHPKQFKALGRQIAKFNEDVWGEHKYKIVLEGNLAKFSQNENMKKFLLSAKNKILVEASPYDKVWGIGLSADTNNIENPLTWKGENLLGFVLMEVLLILSN